MTMKKALSLSSLSLSICETRRLDGAAGLTWRYHFRFFNVLSLST